MNIKQTIKNTLYALPFALTSLIPTTEANGQYKPLPPKGNINLFTSQDTTINAKLYNSLKTKEERDNFINERISEDWVDRIPLRLTPPVWNCNQYSLQLTVNSHDWGEEVLLEDKPLFDNYYGTETDLQKLYQSRGTQKDMGKLGLPLYGVSEYDPITLSEGHGQNYVITGDTLTFENINIIEPQIDATQLQPGDGRSFLPANLEVFQLYYNYIYVDKDKKKNYSAILVYEGKIVEGKFIETYNINNDKRLQYNRDNYYNDPRTYIPLNEVLKLQMSRKDTSTGILERKIHKELKFHPNPARENINIEIGQENIETKIYTIEGKEIINTTEKNINIETLKTGIYIIKTTNNKETYTGKFIKQ